MKKKEYLASNFTRIDVHNEESIAESSGGYLPIEPTQISTEDWTDQTDEETLFIN